MTTETVDVAQGPVNRVLCIVENKDKLDSALAALKQAGFNDEAVGVLQGQEGLDYLDPDGSHHGIWGRILRFLQHHGDEAQLFEQTEAALKSGYYAIGVLTDGSDEQKALALEAVKPHAMFDSAIYFAGHGTLELLARIVD
ncbi:MAG: hypothetical protein AAF629_35950 [Chloroflexota bacterium]